MSAVPRCMIKKKNTLHRTCKMSVPYVCGRWVLHGNNAISVLKIAPEITTFMHVFNKRKRSLLCIYDEETEMFMKRKIIVDTFIFRSQ